VGAVSRPSLDAWALSLAQVVATRGTCLRRKVGCVLLDARGRVLATGYNGVARGLPHCNEPVFDESNPFGAGYPHACPAAGAASGTDLDGCGAVHAEQNALVQCRDPDAVHTCCTTVSPCANCVKLLLATGCRRAVFLAPYAVEDPARRLWEDAGREWTCWKMEELT
jgi:dCMP deaminase